jgi:hypothetical protein
MQKYTYPAGGAGGFTSGVLNTATIPTLVIQVGQGGGLSTSSARPPRPYPNGGLPAVRDAYAKFVARHKKFSEIFIFLLLFIYFSNLFFLFLENSFK